MTYKIDITKEYVKPIAEKIFNMLKMSSNTSETANACLRSTALILRECKEFNITEKQLKLVMGVIVLNMKDIYNIHGQSITFNALKFIVLRKLQSSLVYDAIDTVCKIILQHPMESARDQCADIFIKYASGYKMGRKRLEQHLDFFVSNLKYSEVSGRLSLLKVYI